MKPLPHHDQAAREEALNPKRSFIVQAPAGSGKTELITQRFLTLLGFVKQPEDILSITFTKKAAAEMRDRLLKALTDAHQDTPVKTPHEQTTRQLALKALKQNATENWLLLENPNRLRIQTIDSFNSWLARNLPTTSLRGVSVDIAQDPNLLYEEAVNAFLSHLEQEVPWAQAIEQLLIHLDNDLNTVKTLLIRLLKKRDQWLPYLTLDSELPQLRKQLEWNLIELSIEAQSQLLKLIPPHLGTELIQLASIAASYTKQYQPNSPLVILESLQQLPKTTLQDRPHWLALSHLVLTQDNTWRKSFNKNSGFPASSQSKNPSEQAYLKSLQVRIRDLMDSFNNLEGLQAAWVQLRKTPTPYYSDKQWELLAALHQLLKVAVAELKCVFQRTGKIDYIENAEAALRALGPEDQPTDLALALDYSLKHLLIDEFQDTSHTQYRLLEKLTAGWEENDGRSLFIVGDPMQSIYRFREAEVGLFLKTRLTGLPTIKVTPLTLNHNFRSVPNIVHWVNQTFSHVFPSVEAENSAQGAVSFSASHPTKANTSETSSVYLHPLFNQEDTDQAVAILDLIQSLLKTHSDKKIAILVRSRTHLTNLIPLLRKNEIPYCAVEIDSLAEKPVIQDLIALTKALLHPGDRIAWLSLLRAPWSGLTLNDLYLIANKDAHNTLYHSLRDPLLRTSLSEDGQKRLQQVLFIIEQQINHRRRAPLAEWIEKTWALLGGPATVNQVSDLQDANTFFKLLETLDEGGDLVHFDALDHALQQLFAAPTSEADTSLQIMTMHNAKGLEFDIVILPHLEAKTPHDAKQLLLWMERSHPNQPSQFFMAPIHAVGDETDAIYDYIKEQHQIKSSHETARLLYVAATRAKHQLHCFFSLTADSDENLNPPANSLLEKLWPAIKDDIAGRYDAKTHYSNIVSDPIAPPRLLKRLSLDWHNPFSIHHESITLHERSEGFFPENELPKQIGQVIHRLFEHICRLTPAWWQAFSANDHTLFIRHQLMQQGVEMSTLDQSINIVQKAVHHLLTDERGQWITGKHQQAKTEWALTALIDGKPKQLVIDRSFVDAAGIRWIIDYKSSEPHDILLADFLHQAEKQYLAQLTDYYQALRLLEDRPIKIALYFPLIPAFRECIIKEEITT